ncbi:MAG: helix-turn-helix transcriptional regulator [Polyangiaceae bacterium]
MAATPLSQACPLRFPASAAILRVVGAYVERYELTTAEREILVAVTVDGVSPRRLALAFSRSPTTTKTHVRNLLGKTGHGSFTDLALTLMREAMNGFVSGEMPRVTEAMRSVASGHRRR